MPNGKDLDELVGVVVEELRELFDLLFISCLRRLDQHQQWHARLQEQVTDVVHHSSVQL